MEAAETLRKFAPRAVVDAFGQQAVFIEIRDWHKRDYGHPKMRQAFEFAVIDFARWIRFLVYAGI